MLIVQKFGGSSLADKMKLIAAAEIAATEKRKGNSVVMVVSAMGDTTDDLEELAHSLGGDKNGREMSALMSTGEQQSAALMAMALESLGVRARSYTGWQAGILTSGGDTDAKIALIAPMRLEAALAAGIVPVVAGFQGMSAAGDVTTLGRGGSDTTAVALAAAMKADKCRIYTDVDGIYTADPRIVPDAVRLDKLDYGDMLRLARAGSQVLYSECVELAMEKGIEIELCGAASDKRGTKVCVVDEKQRLAITGVTRDLQNERVSAVGKGAKGNALRTLTDALTEAGIAAMDAEVSVGMISVRIERSRLDEALNVAHEALIEA